MRVIPFIFACFYPFFSYAQCPDMEAVIKTPMLTPPSKSTLNILPINLMQAFLTLGIWFMTK